MNKEYRIVIAHYQSNLVSGAEQSIADFVDYLDKRFQVTMLIPAEGNLSRYFRDRGIKVWIKRVETPRRMYPGLHQVQSWLLAKDFKDRKIDAVLCNTFPAASRVATACRLSHLPYAIYMRDYIQDVPLHRRIIGRANLLFAISKDVIQQHAAMVSSNRFCLAYDNINSAMILSRYQAHLASGKRLLPFDSQHPVVGLVGRITPYKRPDLFIRAIPYILNEVPNARFVVIGAAQDRDKIYEEQVKALAAELHIQEQVVFMGHRKDAVEITSELTIACLASGREPLGRVILEAQLMGIPVVVPDIGGPAEIVQENVTGLLFPSQAPDAQMTLAQQIVRLLKDSTLRNKLAKAGKEHIASTFASRKFVQIQEKYIENLCTSRQRV